MDSSSGVSPASSAEEVSLDFTPQSFCLAANALTATMFNELGVFYGMTGFTHEGRRWSSQFQSSASSLRTSFPASRYYRMTAFTLRCSTRIAVRDIEGTCYGRESVMLDCKLTVSRPLQPDAYRQRQRSAPPKFCKQPLEFEN